MVKLINRINYRNFIINNWYDGTRALYSIVSESLPEHLTAHKLMKQRWNCIDAFTTAEDARNWIDTLYTEAETIDKLLSDVVTMVQFIHLRDQPEIVNLTITTKRELKEAEVIEYLKDHGFEKSDIFELSISTQRNSQPGTIEAKR